jgi:hypothetical protein
VAGWVLMPTLLVVSLRKPLVRYALVAPSTLVGLGLVAICATALPGDGVAAAGWVIATAGILFGSVLGIWFWFRLLPVPPALDDPFSPWRWGLVATHVTLVVAGLALVGVASAS